MGLSMICLSIFLKMILASISLLGTFAGAVAQSVSVASSSVAAIATHTVAVGEAGLVYTPNTIMANVKDVVEFRFYPQNHSVARAEYKYPCIPYEYTGVNKVGFWSGFQPVNVVLQDPPQFSIIVNDTEPIFFYCSAPGACIQDGMVGVINPNSTQRLDVQVAYAENSTLMFSPGEGYPSETPISTISPTSSPRPSSDAASISSGAIASIVIGGIAIIALIGVLCLICRRKKKRRNYSQNTPQGPPSYISQSSPLQQHLEPYQAIYSPKSPPIVEDVSPESYFTQGRFQSPLASPDLNQISSGTAQYPISQSDQRGTLHEPQELAASESMQPHPTELLSRPLSFDDSLQHDRDTIASKIGSM